MGELFGTDGIRAVAGQKPLDQETIYKLATYLTRFLSEKHPQPKILIARDTRASGVWIEKLLVQGIEKSGGSVLQAGVISTPGASFLTRSLHFDAGVVISASHNPYQDNGIKLFSSDGLKISEELERRLEAELLSDEKLEFDPVAQLDGDMCDLRYFHRGSFESYVSFLLSTTKLETSLRKLRMVVDCSNGAAFKLAPKIFSDLGAEVIVIHAQPDGYNINLSCGSLHLEAAQRAVLENKADFSVSFDGDADRALFTGKDGKTIDGDHILYIFSKYLKLKKPAIVSTVMSNLGLEVALRKRGIQLVRTPVGDKYVLDSMLKNDINIGGEQSGHIILSDYSLAGDGLLTALKVLELMVEHKCLLSDLADGIQKLPQVLVNVKVKEKVPFETIPQIQEEIRKIKDRLGLSSRILLRYSGTEPVARIMIEGERQPQIEAEADHLARVIAQKLG